MTRYQELLDELNGLADENYRSFHKKLLKNDSVNVLGVRIPDLRKLAKKYKPYADEVLIFPNDYYEIRFIKLTVVSLQDYATFCTRVDDCVELIDNWALCDCFTPKCIAKNRRAFLPYIEKYADSDREFTQRFALTTLLHYYVEEEYFGEIKSVISRVDTDKYYVHMAVAWLVAETLVKFYGTAVEWLKEGALDKKTHNKAIQKATESYRLSAEQKTFLKGMKK